MRKRTISFLLGWLCCIVFVQGQVSFSVERLNDCSGYLVKLLSIANYAPPLNTTTGALVTILVPTGTVTPGTVTSLNGDWVATSVITSPVENPDYDYLIFRMDNPTTDITYQNGQEVSLFSFTNNGDCNGAIRLMENDTDPFRSPNSLNISVGNAIRVLGASGDAYSGNYQSGNTDCCSANNPNPLFSVNAACERSPSLFTDQTNANNITAWNWNFGDGVGTSNQQNPAYTYTSAGTYTVTLTVTYPDGAIRQVSNLVSICTNVITGSTPMFSSNTACFGEPTIFTNTTDPVNVQSWFWDFGDGIGTSSMANPTYVYPSSGTINTTLTVTFLDNSQRTFTEQVTVLPPIWPFIQADRDTICVGECVRLQAQGGVSFNWSNGETLDDPNFFSPVACPTTTTTYSVTITNEDNCSTVESVTIHVISTASVNAGNDVAICPGESVMLSATANGGYQWSPVSSLSNPNISNPIASPTVTTEYCVTTGNGNGCTATDCVTVTVLDNPTANAGNDITTCAGTPTTLVASGGNSYSWSPSTGLSATNIANPTAILTNTTQYCVTVTDIDGCTDTDCVLVIIGDEAQANAGTDIEVCNGNAAQLMATGGVTYNWLPSTGLSATNIANPIATPATTTQYCVTITNADGCTDTDCMQVIVSGTVQANAGADAEICSGNSFQLMASGGTSYLWSPSVGLSANNIANPIATPASNTEYCVTVTDANGCTGVDCVTVTIQNTAPVNAGDDVVICDNELTTLNASGGVSYSWSPTIGLSNPNIPNPQASPDNTTNYCVTVTNTNGCTDTDCVMVVVAKNPVVNAGVDVSICGNNTAQLNATGGVAYQWSPSTGLSSPNIPNPQASPSTTTTYCVTVTDASGCTGTDCVIVQIGGTVQANAGTDASVCEGGSIQLSASGGISYRWSPTNGLNNPNIANPIATPSVSGDYCVVVTGAGGCTATDCVTLTVQQAQTDAGRDQTICRGDSIFLFADGGTGFQWSPTIGLSNPSIASPIAFPTVTTTYCVITTLNGCTATDCITITIDESDNCDNNNTPAPCTAGAVTAVACEDKSICLGESTQLVVNGGISWSWSPTEGLDDPLSETPIANPVATTTYTVTVTDANGCTDTDEVVVNIDPTCGSLPPPQCMDNPNAVACEDKIICAGASIQLVVSPGASYQWMPASSLDDPFIGGPVATPPVTTTYFVIVTDADGCTSMDHATVFVSDDCDDLNPICISPTAAETCEDKTICRGDNVQLSVSNGASYHWAPPNGLSNTTSAMPIANPTSSITYYVTVTDVFGCTSADEVEVTVDQTCSSNRNCPIGILPSDPMSATVADCNASWNYCLPINQAQLDGYYIFLNEDTFSIEDVKGCQLDYAFAYTYFTIPDRGNRGPYLLENWEVNGVNYTKQFDDIEELVELMNQIDTQGNWVLDASNFTMRGGNIDNSYSRMTIEQLSTNAFAHLNLNTNISPLEVQLELPIGKHNLSIMHKASGCMDELEIKVNCPSEATYISETIAISEQKDYCLNIDSNKKITNFCLEESGNAVQFEIEEVTQCILFEGISEGIETACLLLCEDDNCDTLYLTVNVLPMDGLVPTADEDNRETYTEQNLLINVTANDRAMVAIQELSIIKTPQYGRAIINDNRTITYIPNEDYCDSKDEDYFTYQICNNYGCATAPVRVKVLCIQPKVYSGFSPNGDGINDTFLIDGLANFPNNELTIFNRWGTPVFYQKNYDNTWEGTYQSAPLPDGVYFYKLDDGEGNIQSGFVQINR